MNHGTNEALETVAALREENARLKAENDFYRGKTDHEYGPAKGKYVIARYDIEQRFVLPPKATWWYVKWGQLHWGDDKSEHVEHVDSAFYPPGSSYCISECHDFKRQDAMRCTDEDEQGLYADYEKDMVDAGWTP